MDIARIEAILVGSLGAVDDNQNALPGTEMVDVFIMSIPYRIEKVHEHAAEMVELLKDWPSESWGTSVPPLGEEINYVVAGAVLDDQGRALRLFAFGKLLGWWDILDPHSVLGLPKDNPMAQQLAGMGMVSIMGYRPSATMT